MSTPTSALPVLTSLDVADLLKLVDVSDTTASPAGTDKRLTLATLRTFIAAVAQPLDSDLTAIAGLNTTSYGRSFLVNADAAAARVLMGLGSAATLNSAAVLQAGNNLFDLPSFPIARSNLGLAIGSNVQAYSAVLANIAGNVTSTLTVNNIAATFGALAGSALTLNANVVMLGTAANVLALRNGANAQTLVLYKGYTDASNHSEFSVDVTGAIVAFKRTAAGTGTAITQYDFDGPVVVNGSATYLQFHDRSRLSTEQSGWRAWSDGYQLTFQVISAGSTQDGLQAYSFSGSSYLAPMYDDSWVLGQSGKRWKGMFLKNRLNFTSCPTSASGLSAGDVWNNGGVLNIV